MRNKRTRRYLGFLVLILVLSLTGAGAIKYQATSLTLADAKVRLFLGDYAAAIESLNALNEDPKVLAVRDEIYGKWALNRIKEAPEEAIAHFEAISGPLSEDLEQRYHETVYALATEKMVKGLYKEAYDSYLKLYGYLDAWDLADEAAYQLGSELEAKGDLEEALGAYKQAGEYSDAPQKVIAMERSLGLWDVRMTFHKSLEDSTPLEFLNYGDPLYIRVEVLSAPQGETMIPKIQTDYPEGKSYDLDFTESYGVDSAFWLELPVLTDNNSNDCNACVNKTFMFFLFNTVDNSFFNVHFIRVGLDASN